MFFSCSLSPMKQSYSSSKANHAPASCDNGSMEKTQSGWLSAEDLPTVQELRAGIALFEPLAALFNLDHDKYAEALETRDRLQKQLDEMVNLVDACLRQARFQTLDIHRPHEY